MKARTVAAAVAVSLLFCVTVGAQSKRWVDPYKRGVKAFESKNYTEAVRLLEQAVAADPKAEANKREEGVFTLDYFPYLYLGLAYTELGRFDKAQENLTKARGMVPRSQQAKFNTAEAKVKGATATVTADAGTTTKPAATVTAPTPPPPVRNAAFDAGVREVESSLSGKQFDAAIRKLDQLRGMDADEYAKAGLAAKRDEAVKGFAAQLTDAARASIQASRFKDAQAKLQQADQLLPGQKPVVDLLAELKKRDEDYQRAKAGALADLNAKNYASARGKLQQAQTANPEQFTADNLAPRLADAGKLAATPVITTPDVPPPPPVDPRIAEAQRLAETARQYGAQGKFAAADAAWASALKANPQNKDAIDALDKSNRFKRLRDQAAQLSRSKNVPAAQNALVEARNIDPSRFEREGLAATLDRLTEASGENPSTLALKEGLMALLKGDAQKSIAILQPAVSRDGDKGAAIHAYLGVAYAARALAAPKPDDQSRLRESAIAQFKLAKTADPNYQLSPRIVSPAILTIYQSTRR
jgi:tetratricopeptide (TPR) repeat protein